MSLSRILTQPFSLIPQFSENFHFFLDWRLKTVQGEDLRPWENIWVPFWEKVDSKHSFEETIRKLGLRVTIAKGRDVLELGFDQKSMQTIRYIERLIKNISKNNALSRRDLCRRVEAIYYLALKPFIQAIQHTLNQKELNEVRNILKQLRQRAFNLYNFRERYVVKWVVKTFKRRGEIESKEVAEKIACDLSGVSKELAAELRAPTPSPEPEGFKLLSDQAKNWVDRHKNPQFAQKFLSFLSYRSFAKFKRQLERSIAAFHQHLAQLPPESREYAILIPHGYINKSNTWVTKLALTHLKQNCIRIFEITDELPKKLAEYPTIQHLVLFDDMACSGKQMRNTTQYLRNKLPKFPIDVIVPFMTDTAVDSIKYYSNAWIAPHETLYTADNFKHCFNEKETALLKAMASRSDGLHHMVFTRFAHKLPDYVSTFYDTLFWGGFIKNSIPPYNKCF